MRISITLLLVLLFIISCSNNQSVYSEMEEFNLFTEDLNSSIVAFVNGDAQSFKSKWSENNTVTLAGGFGGEIVVGFSLISTRLDRVSSMYGEFSNVSFTTEVVSRGISDKLGYLVQHEVIEAENESTLENIVRKYRTTMIFQKNNDNWEIIHRQADLHTVEETAFSNFE